MFTFRSSATSSVLRWIDTKSRLLLDLSRGAQRVSPVCFWRAPWLQNGQASKESSLITAETAMPTFFCGKGQFQRDIEKSLGL